MANVENPVHTSEISDSSMAVFEVSHAAGAAAEPEQRWPAMLLLGRILTKNAIAARAWQSIVALWALSYTVSRALGAHSEEHNTGLAWTYDLCFTAGGLLLCNVVPGYCHAVAAGGGLESLGFGKITVAENGRRTLARWKVVLSVVSLISFLAGSLVGSGLLRMGQRSAVSGRVLTPLYCFTVILWNFFCIAAAFPAIILPWVYSLQCGAVIVRQAVTDTIDIIVRYHPDDPEWKTLVVPAVKQLATVTLPRLSTAFGNALGCLTVGMWSAALGLFAGYLEGRKPVMFAMMMLWFFLPFGVASTVTSTSDKCDQLRAMLNNKRGNDLDTHMQVVALEIYLKELNRGQGLGFAVFGIVIDIPMANKILSSLVSFLITVVPILLALNPANLEKGKGTDSCSLTDYQAAIIRSAMLNSNSSCVYNMTIASVIGD